jgi:p-hydroxybenzoate 3-monooxygenase
MPDERFWKGSRRLPREAAQRLQTGRRSKASLRSFVAEPLRFGRLFLAGDAGPHRAATGAKGSTLRRAMYYLAGP